jgi:hypothetical protein
MNAFKTGRRKYLLLVPIIFLVANAFYFAHATREIENAMLHEKLVEIINATNGLAAAVEGNPDRLWTDHELNIKNSVEFFDNLYQIYGGAYRCTDNGLELVTYRAYETSPFEPLDYPEFVEAINNNASGNITINYAPEEQEYRDLHLYYRWMPLYSPPNERYLVITGVSKYSIVTKIPHWVSAGQWVSTVFTFLLNMWLITLFLCFSPSKPKE